MRRAVLVTNMPVPYRERVHELVARQLDGAYHVLYATPREPDRRWTVAPGNYDHAFLRPAALAVGDRVIHANRDVWRALSALDPDVVVTGGFHPTFLLAFLWARRHGRAHVPFTDGWLGSERALSRLHVAIRRGVYRRSQAFLGASAASLALYRHHGAPAAALFQSPLCADNARYAAHRDTPREFDVVLSGKLVEGKQPLFFADVLRRVARDHPNVRALILGDGPLREPLLAALRRDGIAFHHAGHVDQAALPAQYARARLLLFPTAGDAWGVVINEACAVGVPVITSRFTAAAGELVTHGETGYVLDLDAETWARHTSQLLAQPAALDALGRAAFARVRAYSYAAAADGIVAAIRHARAAR